MRQPSPTTQIFAKRQFEARLSPRRFNRARGRSFKFQNVLSKGKNQKVPISGPQKRERWILIKHFYGQFCPILVVDCNYGKSIIDYNL